MKAIISIQGWSRTVVLMHRARGLARLCFLSSRRHQLLSRMGLSAWIDSYRCIYICEDTSASHLKSSSTVHPCLDYFMSIASRNDLVESRLVEVTSVACSHQACIITDTLQRLLFASLFGARASCPGPDGRRTRVSSCLTSFVEARTVKLSHRCPSMVAILHGSLSMLKLSKAVMRFKDDHWMLDKPTPRARCMVDPSMSMTLVLHSYTLGAGQHALLGRRSMELMKLGLQPAVLL
jgi:hypothetical protein